MKSISRVALAVLALSLTPRAALAARIECKAEPDFASIGPDADLARYTVRVLDEAGHPVPNSRLKYTLHAPPRNAFFSTDFPIVEGTTLMEGDAVLSDGTLSFDYLTPIRGDYRLVAEAWPASDTSRPIRSEIVYHINENPDEVRNGAILLALLFGFGVVSGFVIVRPRASRTAAGIGTVALLLSFGAPRAWAHGHAASAPAPTARGAATSDSNTLSVEFSPGSGTVGRLVSIQGTLRDAAGHAVPDAKITIRLHHIEDDKTMYEGSFAAPSGTFEWRNQFFDGAEHKVFVTAAPLTEGAWAPVTFESTIDVEAIDPPMPIVLRPWGFMVFVTAAGMACGAFLARRPRSSGPA